MKGQIDRLTALLDDTIVWVTHLQLLLFRASQVSGPHVDELEVNVSEEHSVEVLLMLLKPVLSRFLELSLRKLKLFTTQVDRFCGPIEPLHLVNDMAVFTFILTDEPLPFLGRVVRHWEGPHDFFETWLKQWVPIHHDVHGGTEEDQEVEVDVGHL